MGEAEELLNTFQRAREAGLDEAQALAVLPNRHLLPALTAKIAAAGADLALIREALDQTDALFRTFAAPARVPTGWWRELVRDAYPEVFALWGEEYGTS